MELNLDLVYVPRNRTLALIACTCLVFKLLPRELARLHMTEEKASAISGDEEYIPSKSTKVELCPSANFGFGAEEIPLTS